MSGNHPAGPPYKPTTATLGGIPNVSTDVPICAVFIAMFISCAITSITIFRLNTKRKHKFLISILLTGFSFARMGACVLRIAYACYNDNVSAGIAASLLVNLGIFLLYIVNLLLAQRILRAKRPSIGWNPILSKTFIILYSMIGVVAVLIITFNVLSYYTLDISLLTASADVSHAVSTYLMVFSVLPYIVLIIAWLPSSSKKSTQMFGHGSLAKKSIILLILTSLMVLEQGYKYGVSWLPPHRPATDLPWYDSRACFYVFGFTLEIIYLLVALGSRVDLLFHVPNGSGKTMSYLMEDNVSIQEMREEEVQKA